MRSFNELMNYLANHVTSATLVGLSILAAVLITYAKDQIRAGTYWILSPLTKALPWNRAPETRRSFAFWKKRILISNYTLVDLFLIDKSGTAANYQKTSSYEVVSGELQTYQEGVTADGNVDSFSTMRGVIVRTVREHGFYISQIALPEPLTKGSNLTNVYSAKLHHCFTKATEHWTQEIAFPTGHLTIQIHFPKDRPPKSVKCSRIEGTVDGSIEVRSSIVDLFGNKSIVCEFVQPRTTDILKVEWGW